MNALQLGDRAPGFRLPGVDGRTRSLEEFAGKPVLVIIFSCNHCPYVQAYEDRMIAIQTDYQDRGVQLVAINSNEEINYPEDNLEHMIDRANAKGYNFPYLRDASQTVERGLRALAARAELFHQVEPFERDVELGVVLVGEQHEVARRAFHAELPQPLVKPDAVVDVYHVVAHFEVAQVGNEARRPRPLPPARRAPVEAAEEVRVAEQQQPQFGDDDAFRHFAADDESRLDFGFWISDCLLPEMSDVVLLPSAF